MDNNHKHYQRRRILIKNQPGNVKTNLKRGYFHYLLPTLFLILSLINLSKQQQQNFLLPGHNLERLRIPETQPVDSVVHQLKAADRLNEARKFSYHMTGDTFSVDEQSGEVRLVKPLDRERQSQLVVVVSVFDVSDSRNDLPLETKRRTIVIEDVDDSRPIFGQHRSSLAGSNGAYQVELSELAPINSIVLAELQVSDADEGANAEIVFECRAKHSTNSACDAFAVESRRLATGKYSVTIRTKLSLDYERVQSYKMSLVARGKRPSPLKGVPLESEAVINISLLNVQDEGPVFINAPYSLSMQEGLKAGTRLLSLVVQDGDAAPQRELSMIVVPSPFSEYFQVTKDPELSKIWYLETNVTIDRENALVSDVGNMFSISLLAAELDESGSPVASEFELLNAMREINYSKGTLRKESVTIVVLDLPDSRPLFVHASSGKPIRDNVLTLNVSESLVSGSPVPNLDLAVMDLDEGINSRFNLSLMDIDGGPPASEAFSLESRLIYGRAEIVLKVLNSSLLDFENPSLRFYKFNLVASKNMDPPLLQILEVQFNIMDANDNWPEFERDQFVVEVPEGAAPGTVVAVIKARDKDSSGAFNRLEYSLRGTGASKFKLVSTEGKIIVNDCGIIQCLDYELQPTFSLTYEAHDGAGKTRNVSLIINLIDINDHSPKFTEPFYKRELISDNLSSKQNYISPQLIVRARDEDGPTQGRNNLTYKILRSNLTGLDVDSVTGLVYLSEPLDLDNMISSFNQANNARTGSEPKIVFEAEVLAQDNGTPSQNSTAKIYLTLKGNQDGAPQFKQNFYQAFVRENHPINKPFFQVQAIDPDEKDSQLRYSLGYDLNDLVDINALTGELSFKTKVDYDDFKDSPYNITVHATDNSKPYPLRATVGVSILIQDVNDKSPKFEEREYKATLAQGKSKVGDVVLQVKASDFDKNALLNYSIITEQLVVFDRNGQQFTMEDIVNSSTGYLSHVSRQERSQLAANLRKLFQINQKSGAIELSAEPDYSFVAVLSLLVRVQDLNQEVFTKSGEIQQDFVTSTFYFQTSTDKSPIFAPPWSVNKRDYNISMLEELAPGTQIFSLLAKDPTTNARIEMFEKVFESDPKDIFRVDRSGLVFLNKRVDYEELAQPKRLSVAVKALTNDVFFSIANLVIQVVDLNDNAPQFRSQNYSAQVSEAEAYPHEILTVHADDKDSAQYGHVYYSLSGYSSEFFSVEPRKGIISIKKGVKLDRESEPVHSLLVTASDCNASSNVRSESISLHEQLRQQETSGCKKSSVFVTINLLDENDNDPIFTNLNKRGEIESITSETASIDAVIAQAKAVDVDEALNGQVQYEIVRGNIDDRVSKLVKIDKDGFISVAGSLSGMGRAQPYKLTIRAFDMGQKQSRQSFVNLLLTISDVVANDGVPRFIRPRADEVISLSENAAPNTFVYQVQAVDPDEDANGKLMYKFMQPSDIFDIDPFEGVIKTQHRMNFHLDRERVSNYTLIVVAQDLGSPPKQAQQIVTIKINDVNDNEPYFERSVDDPPLSLFVEEEAAAEGELQYIGTIQAIDKDVGQNALIGYEILEGNHNNLFKLHYDVEDNSNSSELGNNPCRIYATSRLDREARESYTLTIKASSMSKLRNPFIHQLRDPLGSRNPFNQYNSSDLTKIRVSIKLIDINDNKPIFVQQNSKSVIDSSAEIYSQLMVFKAIDADSSDSEIQYSILDVLYYSDSKYPLNSDDFYTTNYHTSGIQPLSKRYVFDIDSKTGILRNTVPLRSYIDGYFEVFVKADSGGNLHHRGDASEELQLLKNSKPKRAQDNKCKIDNEKSKLNSSVPFYADMENCFVTVTKATVFVTHQRETFRFVFNKTKLNDRLDEFKSKIQRALEEIMFEPESSQASSGGSAGSDDKPTSLDLPRAEKVFLNTFNTDFYEREDGSLDFSTLTSCSQLVRFDDRASQELDVNTRPSGNTIVPNQVISYEEVINLLKTLNATQTRQQQNQRGSLFSQYGLVNVERCLPDKTLYKMTLSERVALYFAAAIALISALLAFIVSNMRKSYEKNLKLLQRSKYQYMSQYAIPSAHLHPMM